MKRLLVFLGAFVLLYVAVTYVISGMVLDTPQRSLAASYDIARDRWGLDLDSIENGLPPREGVSFSSASGEVSLRGWLFRHDTSRCAVIFTHGYGDNRVSMLKYTPYFNRCGCDLLLYDHRGFGESDEAYATGGVIEARDLLAAHRFLVDRIGLPDEKIGWVGESWGAATTLLAAADGGVSPAFVVAESPFSDWEAAITERGRRDYGPLLSLLTPGTFAWVGYRNGLDLAGASPLRSAAQITAPVLLVHSQQDTLTAPVQSDRIAEEIPDQLLTYRPLDWGAWHAHNVVWRPRAYERMLDTFVRGQSPGFCDGNFTAEE